ncbi:hypothetical protein VPNG_05809 [Cytospora leucostoma]|uniref:histidine--tRNA ligase n=1 Tax=Cytospora leucostoma TaxID=1230097 RepID=A0A423X0E2_9PEZI|nr:hypothetical protein VPNG_05809 [Cytospora leucostoma]
MERRKTELTSRTLKTPKGTQDWFGLEVKLRKQIFQALSGVFECHGGQELGTPVFELRDILFSKYGEDSKLIYNLEDQGGEIYSLRYDLTVPFARWIAMKSNVTQVSRYHIAKVYRRDQPAMTRGRYREFYQCDFDIAGEYEPTIPDAEILLIATEAFQALGIKVTIKLNHRRILDGILAVAGVPDEKIRPVSSAVDKLDKVSWDEVRREMIEKKGLEDGVADEIGGFVRNRGDMRKMLTFLRSNSRLMENHDSQSGVEELNLLVSYLEAYDIADKVFFDLSLARGLDYYTGLIFEIVTALPDRTSTSESKTEEVQVGSIAAGGRYDNLVGMYGNRHVPCVRISFGFERIYTILDARRPKEKGGSQSGPEVDIDIVASGGKDDGLLLERMAYWGNSLRQPKLMQQFRAAGRVPITVILGPDELAAGNVRLKVARDKLSDAEGATETDREKNRGTIIPKDNLVVEVNRLLKQRRSGLLT